MPHASPARFTAPARPWDALRTRATALVASPAHPAARKIRSAGARAARYIPSAPPPIRRRHAPINRWLLLTVRAPTAATTMGDEEAINAVKEALIAREPTTAPIDPRFPNTNQVRERGVVGS